MEMIPHVSTDAPPGSGSPAQPAPPVDPISLPARWVPSSELTGKVVMDVQCPACGHRLRTARKNAGRLGRCPACQSTFLLPRHPKRGYMFW